MYLSTARNVIIPILVTKEACRVNAVTMQVAFPASHSVVTTDARPGIKLNPTERSVKAKADMRIPVTESKDGVSLTTVKINVLVTRMRSTREYV